MFGLGFQELLIILAIVLLIFGGKKIPEVASGLGKAFREFKRGASEPAEIDVTPTHTAEQEKDEAKKEQPRA